MTELYNIEYTEKELIKIMIINVSNMLQARNWLENDFDINKNIDNIIKSEDNGRYTIKGKKIFYLKISNLKLNSIKNTDIEEFLTSYPNDIKIILLPEIDNRVRDQILEFRGSEVFKHYDFYINLIDIDMVPKHTLLTENEKQLFMDEYLVKKKDIPRILITDPVSKYYAAKVGDVFRIERPSVTSGKVIFYRMVVP